MKQTIQLISDLSALHKRTEQHDSKYLQEVRQLLKALSSARGVEKQLVLDVISEINWKIDHSKYFLSKDEFDELYKTKNLAEKIRAELAPQTEKIVSVCSQFYKELLLETLSLEQEANYLRELSEIAKTMDVEEETLKRFTKDVSNLHYDKRWITGVAYISWLIHKTYYRGTVMGLENIPKTGACIIAPRHYHASGDPTILNAIVPRKLVYATSVETFIGWRKIMGELGEKFLHKSGSIPFKRDDSKFNDPLKNAIPREEVAKYNSNNIDSARKILTHLQHADAVVIFPEGEAKIIPTYSDNAPFLDPQSGFVRTAIMAQDLFGLDVPIIPIGFSYENKVVGWNAKIRIGKPVNIPKTSKESREFMIEKYTQSIFEQIKELSK